ncbi:LysR family transcriptional regulator [Actinomadura sp. NTSP31]|uniref:LysR family transcriptional regulator n=1 Tax=Actinomadura sp. NTSP31 TaxID=1735447 RepID=UPI0035C0C513
MNLSRYDLNLLVALRALLEERNVTRAGERLGLSQPAASNALARLRRQFGDELLVRSGQAMELTPLARALLDMVTATLTMAERTYEMTSEFDPVASTRRFTVVGSDYGLSLLAAPLRELDVVAPGVHVRLDLLRAEHLRDPEGLLRRADFMVAPRAWLHGLPAAHLSTDEWVGVIDRANRAVGDRLTMDELRTLRLVGLFDEPPGDAHIGRQLEVLGIESDGRISVESFLEVPFLVEHTERLGLLPRRMAERSARSAHIRLVALPFEAAELVEMLCWHPRADPDPGHRWFRTLLGAAAAPDRVSGS